MALKNYYLGCPIWANKSWVGELFTSDAKPADYLAQYSSVFNTVEGNSTFYGLPSEASVQKWLKATPDGFRFCFKFPRSVSHERRLENAEAETEAFLERLTPLRERLGPLFLQLPPSFGPDGLDVLDRYLRGLPSDWSYAVEVRHPALFDAAEPELNGLLGAHGVDRAIFDTRGLHGADAQDAATVASQRRKPRLPVRPVATGPRPFVRFVAHPEVEANRTLLDAWARTVGGWIAEGRTPCFFTHAPDDFYAPRVARLFHALLSEARDVGDLPAWPAERPQERTQLSLF
jgi:uncharacterized protein YecE (DUF72 family)